MRAMLAREELRKIKRRVTRKHRELAEAGATMGGDSFGYRCDHGTKTLALQNPRLHQSLHAAHECRVVL